MTGVKFTICVSSLPCTPVALGGARQVFSLVTFPHTNEYCAPSKFDPDNRYVDNH